MSTGSQQSSEVPMVAATLVLGTLGAATLLILPGLLGILGREYGFDEKQLGAFSLADLGGVTLGSAIGAKFLGRIGMRRGARLGLILAATANMACTVVETYRPLLALRVIAGLGAGVCVAVCYINLGQSRHVDRNFSFYLVSQGLFGAAGLKVLPWLSGLAGAAGIFTVLTALYAAAILSTPILPTQTSRLGGTADGMSAPPVAWLGLAGVTAYFVAQGGIWAFLEAIGIRGGLAIQAAATGLAVAMLAGLLGAAMAAVLGARFGQSRPLLLGLLMALASLTLLGLPLDSARFAMASSLFQIAWNFSIPYQLAVISRADPTGRVVGWAASASLAGLAVGPALAALALDVSGVTGVLTFGAAFCILSVGVLMPAWTRSAHAAESGVG